MTDAELEALLGGLTEGPKPTSLPTSPNHSSASTHPSIHPLTLALPSSADELVDNLGALLRDSDSTKSKWSTMSRGELVVLSQTCKGCVQRLEGEMQGLVANLATCVMSIENIRLTEATESTGLAKETLDRIRPVITQTQEMLQRLVVHRKHVLTSLATRIQEQTKFYKTLKGQQREKTLKELEGFKGQTEANQKVIEGETLEALEKVKPVLIKVLEGVRERLTQSKERVGRFGEILTRLGDHGSSVDTDAKIVELVHPLEAKLRIFDEMVQEYETKLKNDPRHLLHYTALAHLKDELAKWPESLAPLHGFLATAKTNVPSLEECKQKWALAKRLLKEAQARQDREDVETKREEAGEVSELDVLLSGKVKSGGEGEKDVERLQKAKVLASRMLLSRVLLNYKATLTAMQESMERDVAHADKVSKVVKTLTERYVRRRTMLGMQLEQMVLMLEESVKEETVQLVRATCRSIGSMVESVNISLRESCKEADLAILNLVNYMKNMVIVGLPLVDSSLFKKAYETHRSHDLGGTTCTKVPPDTSSLALRRVFDQVQVFVKECETLQTLLQRHEAESWKSMFASVPADLGQTGNE